MWVFQPKSWTSRPKISIEVNRDLFIHFSTLEMVKWFQTLIQYGPQYIHCVIIKNLVKFSVRYSVINIARHFKSPQFPPLHWGAWTPCLLKSQLHEGRAMNNDKGESGERRESHFNGFIWLTIFSYLKMDPFRLSTEQDLKWILTSGGSRISRRGRAWTS